MADTQSENKSTLRKRGRFDKNLYSGVPTIEYDGDRHEKPWQRVIDEVTRKGTHLYEPVKSVPSYYLVLLLGVYLLLAYFTQLVEDRMPRVISDTDVRVDDSTTFSEEAAWRYLNIILGDQPRVAGTKYHLQKTIDLKNLVDDVARTSRLPVQTDWQMVDGDYWITFSPPYVNAYQNVSNIIVLLEGQSGFFNNGTIGTSLLVNCHYDSVPYALGTSDNAIFCAAMVETLSRMARRQERFKHNVIFLFNGAEENPIQGSHAFLKHPWAKGVTNVINLDAAGMNGKPIVFQVTDPRTLNAYKRVVSNPSGQSVGEFMFKTGVIPSDTDFRIWRDFGNFNGVDIAFVKWSHVYHTRYDHPSLVRTGVIQNAGNMLLALVSEMADDDILETQIEPSAAVYYDYLHWFMVTYSFAAATAIDVLVVVYALVNLAYYVWLVGFRWSTVRELLLCVVNRLLSMAGGIVVTAVCVAITVAATIQLRYMTQPWVVVPLYWLPYLMSAIAISHVFDGWRTKANGLNRSIRSLQAQTATRLLLALILLILCCIPSVTTLRYIFTLPLFLMTTFSFFTLTLVRYIRLQAWQQLLLECVLSIPTVMFLMAISLKLLAIMLPTMDRTPFIKYFVNYLLTWQQLLLECILSIPTVMFLMAISLKLLAIMLPTMGRTPTNRPDYTIAIICVGLAVLVSSTVSGIELLFSRRRLWTALVPVSVACIIIMFVPMSPYQDDGPSVQRHYWFHSEVTSYDFNQQITEQSSGVLITKHDAYTLDRVLPALQERGINLNYRTDFTEDCQRYVFCNLPLFRVRFGEYLIIQWKRRRKLFNSCHCYRMCTIYVADKSSLMLNTGPPAPFSPPPSVQVSNRTCQADRCTLQFTMIGPAHNMVTLWPRPNVTLTSWSLSSPLLYSFVHQSRPVFVIIHSSPTYSEPFRPLVFSVDLRAISDLVVCSLWPRPNVTLTSWSLSSPLLYSFVHQSRPVFVIIHSSPTYSEPFRPMVFSVDLRVAQSLQNSPIVEVSHHAHKINHPEDYTTEYSNLLNAMPKYFNIASFLSFRMNYQF